MPERPATNDSAGGGLVTVKGQEAKHCHREENQPKNGEHEATSYKSSYCWYL